LDLATPNPIQTSYHFASVAPDMDLPLRHTDHEQDPGAEFNDPNRIRLIEQLEKTLSESVKNPGIPSTGWAFLWLGDLDKLEEFIQLPPFIIRRYLLSLDIDKPVQLCMFYCSQTFMEMS
jgi:hypothetical protein